MSKLQEDEKVVKLVDREVKRAIKTDRKRILDSLKSLKEDFTEIEDNVLRRARTSTIAAANKIVRDVA